MNLYKTKGNDFLELFQYGDHEIQYLKNKDKTLAAAIEQIGPIARETDADLFRSLINSIVAQQISAKALETVWNRMLQELKEITPQTIAACPVDKLQQFGISFRKADYIKNAAEKVQNGVLDLSSLSQKSDEEVCKELSSLKGVGVWTAEMLMIFSMQRPNILSYGDLAIQRGLRMLYHHRAIDRKLFAKYQRRYSPYATVASLYLWAIAGGAIPEMKDYAPKVSKTKKKQVKTEKKRP